MYSSVILRRSSSSSDRLLFISSNCARVSVRLALSSLYLPIVPSISPAFTAIRCSLRLSSTSGPLDNRVSSSRAMACSSACSSHTSLASPSSFSVSCSSLSALSLNAAASLRRPSAVSRASFEASPRDEMAPSTFSRCFSTPLSRAVNFSLRRCPYSSR